MDKDEKLTLARKKLMKFQARNSPQRFSKESGVGAGQSAVASPLPLPTLAGALPPTDHPNSAQTPALTVPVPFNGLPPNRPTLSPPSTQSSLSNLSPPSTHPSLSRPTLSPLSSSTHPSLSNPTALPSSSSFTPSLDLASPLTAGSSTRASPVNYSLPTLVGGVKNDEIRVRPLSEQAHLNGSIVDHLRPLSSAAPSSSMGLKIEPPFTSSEGPPPYGGTRQVTVHTGPINSATEEPIPYKPGKGLSIPSGASHGGVLLKHIPYLPSGSVGVVSEVASRQDGGLVVEQDGSVAGGDVEADMSTTGEEVAELEQKIRAHAQTIDILVSEKSALQMELGSLKTQLSHKSRECQDWESHGKSSGQKLSDLEKELLTASSALAGKQEAKSENAELRKSLERLRASLEDQQEEGTELISKVTAQSAEMVRLQTANMELQSKLSMAELLTQQLSGGKPVEATPTDPTLLSRLQEAEGKVKQLKRNLELAVREKEQVDSDLSVLRNSMVQQQEDSKRKLREFQTQQAEGEAKLSTMERELRELALQKGALEREVFTEHAQSEHSSRVAMESVQQEIEQLKTLLEKQVQENIRLVKTNTELESHALEAELRLSRLQEQSVDHQNLLTTMAQDKETLNRAMSQNKELKRNMAELQDAFIKLSHQNMELASELETERQRVTYLRAQLAIPRETTPIPIIEVESVTIPPLHMASNPASNPVETTPTSAQHATPILPSEATLR